MFGCTEVFSTAKMCLAVLKFSELQEYSRNTEFPGILFIPFHATNACASSGVGSNLTGTPGRFSHFSWVRVLEFQMESQ
jgi:hypothetical protein